MNISLRRAVACCAFAAIGLLLVGPLPAADLVKQPSVGPSTQQGGVEMFAAMKQGDLDVKIIPRSDREARVLFKNNTDKPLSVRLPDAFAAVPVLAQAALGGGRDRDRDDDDDDNQNQGIGGGFGGGGFGGGGFGGGGGGFGGQGGGGGGFFNVPAEKTRQIKVATVCLEHGKRDPKPNIPYEIKPVESFTSKPATHQLLRLLGSGKIDQRAAQAAAWHLENGMSWQQLATKQIKHLVGASEPYFRADEIARGVQAAEFSKATARPAAEPSSASTSASTAN